MTDITEEKLIMAAREAKKAALSPGEKMAMRSHVADFIKRHPRIEQAQPPHWFGAYFSSITAAIYRRPALRYVSLAAMVLLVGGGSIAFAAQNALPGDALYPFKTQVTEKVLALTLFSNQAKAEYDINLTQLRLEETETAAAQNKLDSQTTSEVRALFNDHVADIQNKILTINKAENVRTGVELNSQLEGLLKAHAKVLDDLAANKTDNDPATLKNILSDIQDKTSQITAKRKQDESVLSGEVSANAKINAQNKLLEARAGLREAGPRADTTSADQNVADGQAKLKAEDYNGAFILFQDAARTAQEINTYTSRVSKLQPQFKHNNIK